MEEGQSVWITYSSDRTIQKSNAFLSSVSSAGWVADSSALLDHRDQELAQDMEDPWFL
jgi:hypothetical protein